MAFELVIVDHIPATAEHDLDAVMRRFLIDIGYLTKGYGPRDNAEDVFASVPYRLFVDCFLKHQQHAWDVKSLLNELNTTLPTLYRHLNKIKNLDLLIEVEPEDPKQKKAYMLRYQNFSEAWSFPETHAEIILRLYRRLIEKLQRIFSRSQTVEESTQAGSALASAPSSTTGTQSRAPEHTSFPDRRGLQAPRHTLPFLLTLSDSPFLTIGEAGAGAGADTSAGTGGGTGYDAGGSDRQELSAQIIILLKAIGYITPRGLAQEMIQSLADSYPYRLFTDCLLQRMKRFWTAEELAAELDSSVHTVYQHLNKLRAMDLIEEQLRDGQHHASLKRTYRIRYGDLSRAWYFSEAHIKQTMGNYRKTVDHIQTLIEEFA